MDRSLWIYKAKQEGRGQSQSTPAEMVSLQGTSRATSGRLKRHDGIGFEKLTTILGYILNHIPSVIDASCYGKVVAAR